MRPVRSSWNVYLGLLLLLAGLLLLIHNLAPFPIPSQWLWAGLLCAGGLTFLYFWATARARWWAIIPAGTLLSLAVAIFVSNLPLSADYGGTAFLLGLGATFLTVYWTHRARRWALIPAGIFAWFACSSLLSELPFLPEPLRDTLPGSVFLAGLSIAFLILALIRRDIWWPILPAGFLLVLATMPLLNEIAGLQHWIPVVFFTGVAIVFLSVHLTAHSRWSLIAAVIAFAVGLFVQLAAGPGWFTGSLAALAMIALGTFLLLRRGSTR
ncbi:MAG: hypothetical protein ACP5SI_10860 [Chloroflexia bacterium]